MTPIPESVNIREEIAQALSILVNNETFHEVAEETRCAVFIAIENFFKNKLESLKLPSSFTAKERAFAHIIARLSGLYSESETVIGEKILTISALCPRKTLSPSANSTAEFRLTWNSKNIVVHLLQTNPVTAKEKLELYPRVEGASGLDKGTREERQRGTTGRLMGAVPQIPTPPPTNWNREASDSKKQLINSYRQQIVHQLNSSQVVIISGPPGCGKTTILPQILMDECFARGQRCRMICSQPRRLYAHINAERLAHLRGENVGQTIGYQIRLESKVSPRTLLTFCTHGVLLRTIYADSRLMVGTTHIIVDEIEEDEIPASFASLDSQMAEINSSSVIDKNRYADNPNGGCGILLGILPSLLSQYPHLKVVLVINTHLSTYKSWYNNTLKYTEHDQTRVMCCSESDSLAASVNISNPITMTNPEQLPNGVDNDNCVTRDNNNSLIFRNDRLDLSRTKFEMITESPQSNPGFLIPPNMYFSNLNPINNNGILSMNNQNKFDMPQIYSVPDYTCKSSQVILSSSSSLPKEDSCSSTPSPCLTKIKSPLNKIQNDPSLKTLTYEPLQGFSKYFNGAPVINIPHNTQQVKTYYLEDILEWTNYSTSQMDDAFMSFLQDTSKCQNMYFWLKGNEPTNYNSREYNTDIFRENNANDMVKDGILFETAHFNVIKKPPVVFNDQMKVYLESDQLFNKVKDREDIDSASNPKRHANNLLWTIWRSTVHHPSGLKPNKCQNKENDESEINGHLHSCLTNLFQCILASWISVDYEHSNSGLTPLMVCSAAGLMDAVDRLLGLGANPFTRLAMPYEVLISQTRNNCQKDFELLGPQHRKVTITNEVYTIVGVNAYDLARIFGHDEVAGLLRTHMVSQSLRHEPENWEAILLRYGSWFQSSLSSSQFDNCTLNENQITLTHSQKASTEKRKSINQQNLYNKLLLSYQLARNCTEPETTVDYDLLTMLIVKIDSSLAEGTILVFLPSYEEIITLRERLLSSEISPWKSSKRPLILILHSRMLVADLKTIYARSKSSVRRLILSSNIAESCMTFDDVSYVIDCGLDFTGQYLDWTETTALRNHWITKSNAIQRQTRTGENKNGICFHLYSSLRFSMLSEGPNFAVRGHTVEEACIQARLLSPPNISIETVLRTLPKPPLPESSRTAIQGLKEMDALDNFEELTELGYHICDIPIPAHYAKMVLVSVVLKCLDPILTIACILAYTEPFTIPRNDGERRDLMNARKKFSADTYSDHMMLLRAFQFWQKSRSEGWEKNFCQKNFISTTAFEVITAIRTQLLGQLRASGFVKARGSGDIRDLNSNSENWAVVKAAIVAGMHGNLARLDRKNSCLRMANGNKSLIMLHPNSVIATNSDGTKMDLNNLPCDWLVFDEVLTLSNSNANDIYESMLSSNSETHFSNTCMNSQQQNNHLSTSTENNKSDLKVIKCASIISPITVALMAGPIRLWPEMIKESQSNVNGFNPTKIPTEEAKQQIHQCQTVCSNTKNKNENNNNIIYGGVQEEYETESESDSDSETQGIVKSLLQNSNNNNNSNSNNNSQLSRIHMNIREVLGEIIQQKTKTSGNSTDAKSKVDTPQAPTQPSDPIINLSTNFNTIKVSDHNKHNLKSLPIQQQSQLIPNLTYSPVDQSNPIMSMMSSSSLVSTSTSANDQTNTNTSFCLDSTGFLRFILNSNEAQMVIGLRQKWHALFLRRLKNPGKQCSQQDEAVLNCLTNVLMTEEQALGLRQPSGVGARPRPMAAELCNQLDCSQNDTSQIAKVSTGQSMNNKIAHCIITESKTPITTITSSNTNQLDQDSLRCKYPLFTRPSYASQITNFTLLNDFSKTNEQGSFQASRREQYMDKHTSITPVMESTGNTGRLTSFPTANNSRCDCQACSDNPNYVLANPLSKLNIIQSEDKGTSSISNLNSNFPETPIHHISLHGNQNSSLLNPLVNLNRVNSLEMKQQPQRQQQQQQQQQPYDHNEIQNNNNNNNNNQINHHHSLKWESINYSSNSLKESYRLNNLISNFATLSFPATPITISNDSSSSSNSNALISDHSLGNLNNRLSVTQTTNIWSSNNEADFKLLNYGINK